MGRKKTASSNKETKTSCHNELKKKINDICQESNSINSFQNNSKYNLHLEDEIEYKFKQRNVFLVNSCQICKNNQSVDGGKLKKCSNCKMINYCSKEHQMAHWKYHKELCKGIVKVCKNNSILFLYERTKGLTHEEFRYFRVTMLNKTSQELGRELELWEKEMFYFPEVCGICFESNSCLIEVCIDCSQVFFCKSHSNGDHSKWCKDMKLYRDLIQYQEKNAMLQPELNINHRKMELEGKKMKEVLVQLIQSKDWISMNSLIFSVVTDNASCPLTLKLAFEKLHMTDKKELTVHIVGAESFFELDNISKWEKFLIHLLPDTEKIKIIFLGPELVLSELLKEYLNAIRLCKECVTREKVILYEYHERICYHEYVSSKEFRKPDLICAFNAGMYRETGFLGSDSWKPSIDAMLDTSVPILVTEYTQMELNLDLQRIQKTTSTQVVLPPSQNPFASLKPSLNFVSEEITPLIYKNYYYMIVIKKKNINNS